MRAHHVAIVTPSLARLRAFYVDSLGLPEVGGFPEHGILFLGAGDLSIELVEEKGGLLADRGAGWHHLALEVADVDQRCADLSARGVPFHSWPEDFPPEAPSMRIAFCRDPDGNVVELLHRLCVVGPTVAPTVLA
jgi:glyoxylase I family protein